MTISRRCRKAHDPWGNKFGNSYGHIVGYQFMVSKATLRDDKLHSCVGLLDKSKSISYQYDRFVKGPHSTEGMRR